MPDLPVITRFHLLDNIAHAFISLKSLPISRFRFAPKNPEKSTQLAIPTKAVKQGTALG
jgi:hypothetical protein